MQTDEINCENLGLIGSARCNAGRFQRIRISATVPTAIRNAATPKANTGETSAQHTKAVLDRNLAAPLATPGRAIADGERRGIRPIERARLFPSRQAAQSTIVRTTTVVDSQT